jgi:ATP-dependent DNA helicase RecG
LKGGTVQVDILGLEDRIINECALHESHFREFKSAVEGAPGAKQPRAVKAICRDIAEALVGFANADGGSLLVGVEDDGAITGVPHGPSEREAMLAAPNTYVHKDMTLPLVISTSVVVSGKIVLFFSVNKGVEEEYVLSDGRCVRRSDKETVPAAPKTIRLDRQELRSREYDRQFVDGASITDLDANMLNQLAKEYLQGLSGERYLQQLGLAEYDGEKLRLRRAALLMFAKDVRRWQPFCQVRLVVVPSEKLGTGESYRVAKDELLTGNITDLVSRAWEALRSLLTTETVLDSESRFIQRYSYPDSACQEALINAVAHRDYSIHRAIEIFLFTNRLEVKSPGLMLSTISLEDVLGGKGVHESRNSLVARVLRELKLMRELGEGIRRVIRLMDEHDLAPPEIQSEAGTFTICLSSSSVFSDKQLLWLDLFQNMNLTRYQKRILCLGIDGREITPHEIYQAIGSRDRDIYDREIKGLREAGVLISCRSNMEAKQLARKRNVHAQRIGRFKVNTPDPRDNEAARVPHWRKRNPRRCVYVTFIPHQMLENDVKELFSECGKVVEVVMPRNPYNDQPKGFAFVWFSEEASALKAIERFHGHRWFDRTLKVAKFEPTSARIERG